MWLPIMRGGPAATVFVGNTKNAYSTLTKEDVIDHFMSLEESFIKFACSNKTFKELCVGDRTELLKSNSILFVMVSRNKFKILFLEVIADQKKNVTLSYAIRQRSKSDTKYFLCVC